RSAATTASSPAGSRSRATASRARHAGPGRCWPSCPPTDARRWSGRARRRPRHYTPFYGEEERVSRAGAAALEPRVDVVGARRRLERHERVLRVAPDRGRDEVQAALEVVGWWRDDGPCLDGDGRGHDLGRREEAATAERTARDRDPDGRVGRRGIEGGRRQERRGSLAQ